MCNASICKLIVYTQIRKVIKNITKMHDFREKKNLYGRYNIEFVVEALKLF